MDSIRVVLAEITFYFLKKKTDSGTAEIFVAIFSEFYVFEIFILIFFIQRKES